MAVRASEQEAMLLPTPTTFPPRPRRRSSLSLMFVLASAGAMALFYVLLSLSPCMLGSGRCYRGFQSRYSFDANRARHPSWMAALPDDANLTALSIPGTHDTMTAALAATLPLQCQNWDLQTQLDAGIRYLDIRARVAGDRLHIFHADGDTGYDWEDILVVVFDFLDENPSETVVMRLKEEGPPVSKRHDDDDDDDSDEEHEDIDNSEALIPSSPFETAFNNYLHANPVTSPRFPSHLHHYSSSSPLPSLGSLRNTILLLQEFPAPLAGGPDSHGIEWDGDRMSLEDVWIIPDIAHLPAKWDAVRTALELASSADAHDNEKLFLAHVSASVGVLPIEAAAGPADGSYDGLNDQTGEWLLDGENVPDDESGGASRTGIVILDFPGRQLIDAVLSWNDALTEEDYFDNFGG